MLLIVLSAPLCLLCFYLAWLCGRQARYRHGLVLLVFGLALLVVTLGLLGAGYLGRTLAATL